MRDSKDSRRSPPPRPARDQARIDYEEALRLAQKSLEEHGREALALLQRAAAADHPLALYALSTWYHFGVVVRKNRMKAVQLAARAAACGVPDAVYNLAVSHELGEGVAKDEARAFRLFCRAARRGVEGAEYEVGRCYFWGVGVKANRRAAARWFARARKQGDEAALDLDDDVLSPSKQAKTLSPARAGDPGTPKRKPRTEE